MKKITFLLTLLGVSASSAFAGVLTPSTDSESHVFAIKNSNNNYYCTVNGNGIGSTQDKSAVALFKATAGTETGKYYLFCTTNNKYVTYSGTPAGGPAKVLFTDSKDDAKQWKIKLEANQTERYDIFPEDVTGNAGDLSWNWHGGIGNNMGFYGANDANSTWTFDEFVENATFTYQFNGTTVATKTSRVVGSSDIPTSGLNFVSNASMEPATLATGTNAYTITLAEALPFTKSTSFDNATWYVMDMHSNDSGTPDVVSGEKNYAWTFSAADEDVTLPKQVMSEATYSDNMLWCFVGDVVNGFKIYNKAAGSTLSLRKAETGNTAAVMSATNDHNLFKLYPTTENIANGFCLKLDDDTHYVNTQVKSDDDATKVLRGWDATDGGSTCRVFAPNKFVVDAAAVYNNSYVKSSELPAGALGANSYLDEGDNLANFKAAYAAANTTTATIEQINALSALMKSVNAAKSSETVEVGKYYRLYNKQYNKYLSLSGTPSEALTKIVTDANTGKNAASVVWFTNAETGRYRMMLEGYTFGKAAMSTNVKLVDNNSNSKGSYQVTSVGRAFGFQDLATSGSYNYLHAANGGSNIVGWEIGATASQWYIVPATDVEIDLNTVGSSAYASAYLPFAVSGVEGAEAYVGTLNDDKSALDMTQVESVPANNGFVLVGTGSKATLTIGTADAVTSNSLTGTNTGITLGDDTRANYLVFGKNADVVGFYAPSTSVTNIGANKAYLDATALTGEGAIAMNFGGTTTAINTAIVNNQGVNAPVFDLSGRRVVAPVKGGVYIQNGKKFIK